MQMFCNCEQARMMHWKESENNLALYEGSILAFVCLNAEKKRKTSIQTVLGHTVKNTYLLNINNTLQSWNKLTRRMPEIQVIKWKALSSINTHLQNALCITSLQQFAAVLINQITHTLNLEHLLHICFCLRLKMMFSVITDKDKTDIKNDFSVLPL
jgi:hypothetical protein